MLKMKQMKIEMPPLLGVSGELFYRSWSRHFEDRRRIIYLAILITVAFTLIHTFFTKVAFQTADKQPFIRKGNRFHKNPYGEQGGQRLPKAIVIGIRKAGTRAALKFLNLHPDIAIAKAECHFFAYTPNYNQGLEFYRKQMPYTKANQITIEKTPNYFHRGDVAAERIHAMNSSVKVILVVREPAARALSDYIQFYQNKGSTYSFQELAFTNGEVNTKYAPVKRSNYYHILDTYWLKYFPKEQIHIVDGDAIGKTNPGKEMKLLQQFLGVRTIIDEHSFVFDENKKFYCVKLQQKTKCLGATKGRNYTSLDKKVMDKLKAYYRPYNNQLFTLIGRDLGWNS